MPRQVPVVISHFLPVAVHFPPILSLLSIHITHTLSPWKKTHWEIGRRSVDFCWLQLTAQHQLLGTVQNMTRVFSSASVKDYCACMWASLWEKSVSPWAVSVSVLWFTRLGYAKQSTRPGKAHVGLNWELGWMCHRTHSDLLMSCQ